MNGSLECRRRILLGADAVGGTLLLNRLALAGYVAFVVGRYAIGG
ncbi:hypothetical protein AB0K51_26650 [Kitasatospora sp. NPDC049285]